MDHKNGLDHQAAEISDNNVTVNDLRHHVDEKARTGACLADELAKCKAVLGEKCLEAHKAREDSAVKGHELEQNRACLAAVTNDIEVVRADRAAQSREIACLTDRKNILLIDGQKLADRLA